MKIDSNNMSFLINKINSENNQIKPNKIQENEEDFSKTLSSMKMDTVSIRNTEMSDSDFIKQISNDIAAEVKAGKTEDHLNDIKMQIALGKYNVNADGIVDRIIGESY